MTTVLGSLVYRGSVLLQQPVAWSDKMSVATKLAVGESSDIDRCHDVGRFLHTVSLQQLHSMVLTHLESPQSLLLVRI